IWRKVGHEDTKARRTICTSWLRVFVPSWLKKNVLPPAPLVIEQPRFALEAAAVAGQRSGRSDDAVTRDDDRDRIRAVGGAHRARGVGRSDFFRDCAVAARLAGRNPQ